MRITTSMISQNVLYNINKNLEYMDSIYNQMASGKKIQVPSDDPVCAAQSLKYQTYVSQIEQYQDNAGDALSWMKVSEQSLSDLEDMLQRVRELTVQASNDTLTGEDYEMIKAEVIQLTDSIIEIGNQTYAGKYIFAGYDTDRPPFEVESTEVGEMITYKAEYLSITGPFLNSISDEDCIQFYEDNLDNMYEGTENQDIMYNIGISSEIDINVEGTDVFGQGVDGLFETLKKLEMALNEETTYKTIEVDENPPYDATVVESELDINSLLENIDENLDDLLVTMADLGARMSLCRIDSTKA